ncbi:hypothetical protein PSACC_00930 [Paramicrosporidium saccamoebae]|uniref:Uncharacterized protein n=1 Tax=Paramicrosporidium saccamoebae TaxID=1246581 RepID=A0A2H9TNE5_9FUNG|nr:hypothetical protein PSACC_00930 [Paramicrosporidium saccamoebae]
MDGVYAQFKRFLSKYGLGLLVIGLFFALVLTILLAILVWMHRERRKQERIDDRRNSMDLLEKGQQEMRPRRDSESSSTEPAVLVAEEINDQGLTMSSAESAFKTTSPVTATKTASPDEAVIKPDSPASVTKAALPVFAVKKASPDTAEREAPGSLDEGCTQEPASAGFSELSNSDSAPDDLPSRSEPPLPSVPDSDENGAEAPQTRLKSPISTKSQVTKAHQTRLQSPISTESHIISDEESSRVSTQTGMDPEATKPIQSTVFQVDGGRPEDPPKSRSGWGRTGAAVVCVSANICGCRDDDCANSPPTRPNREKVSEARASSGRIYAATDSGRALETGNSSRIEFTNRHDAGQLFYG